MTKRNWHQLADEAFNAEQAVAWASSFRHSCVLLSNGYSLDQYGCCQMIVAAGAERVLSVPAAGNALEQLQDFCLTNNDWIFGFLTYELKNEIEQLSSVHCDGLGFPVLEFFIPRIVFLLDANGLRAGCLPGSIEEHDLNSIVGAIAGIPVETNTSRINGLSYRIDKPTYLERLDFLKEQIHYGNIYEVNFCHEMFAEGAELSPTALFTRLNRFNPSPFAAFLRSGPRFALCSSPERWLCRRNNKLVSQPIKGTAPRGSNPEADRLRMQELRENPKEQSENVMIVDLVRNDLSRVAADRSVKVEELFGIYSFPKVHQMISTVSCELRPGVSLSDIIHAAFPMGSMTGAPKIKAMQLIEETEATRRGLFSGSIGYISPTGDFDFNVVIRSILYNADNKYLSLMAGGAITAASDPQLEYEESLLKMNALKMVIEGEG